MSVAMLSLALLQSPAQAAPILGSQPYAFVMCRYAGDPYEPAQPSDVVDLLGLSGGNPGTVDHAFVEMSYGLADLGGSDVFGWYELPGTKASYAADLDADVHLTEDCVDLAIANGGLDPSAYVGVVSLLNSFVPTTILDAPAVAYHFPLALSFQDGSSGSWRVAWFSHNRTTARHTYTHELGHTFGFRHSTPHGSSLGYGNIWDLMSSGSCGSEGDLCVDVHPIAYNKSEAGWTAGFEEVLDAPTPWTGTSWDFRLYELARQPIGRFPEPLLVKVLSATNDILTIEARASRPDTNDGYLPASGVIVHHVDTPGAGTPNTTVFGDVGANWQVDPDSSRLTPGEVFTHELLDSGLVTISVLAENLDFTGEVESYDIRVELGPYPPFTGCAPGQQDYVSEAECQALADLGDLASTVPAGWEDTANPCLWPGVTCDDLDGDGVLEVTRLWLNEYPETQPWDVTLAGDDDLFADLIHLEDLRLKGAELDGVVPESIWSVTTLEFLTFQGSGLTGTISPAVGGLTQLWHLNFGQTSMSGGLPEEIGQLASLEHLNTLETDLTGPLPMGMKDLGAMEQLYLSPLLCVPDDPGFLAWWNALTATVPASAPLCAGIYVDDSAAPGGNGSPGAPFQTIAAAYAAAAAGDRIVVAAGTYPEALTLTKPVRIEGSGPLQTTIPYVGSWNLNIAGVELTNLWFQGDLSGIAVRATRPYLIQDCQFDDHSTAIHNTSVAGDTLIADNRFFNNAYGVLSEYSGWSNYFEIANNVFVDGTIGIYNIDSRGRANHNLVANYGWGIAHYLPPSRNLPISYVQNNLIVGANYGILGFFVDPHELKVYANSIDANVATYGTHPQDELWTQYSACDAPYAGWLPYQDDFVPGLDCVDAGYGSDPDGTSADIGPYGGVMGGPWWVTFPCVGAHCP